MRLLHELRRERDITLVSVLHDCALAETFADRILGMEAGRIVHDGSAGEVASSTPMLLPHTMPTSALPSGGGIRGFRRFEACVALEAMNTPAAAPAPSSGAGLLSGRVRPLWYAGAAIVALAVYASAVAGLGITSRATEGAAGNIASFVARLVPRSWAQVTSIDWLALLASLWATIQMSFVGTTLAVLVSWPLAALAARNVGPRSIRGAMRFLLNGIRSVPSILWALLFVAAVGLGEFAGVLALVAYSIGYLTKFFYEGFEAVDPGAPSALAEIGASGPQQFVHAVWPAARAAVLSSVLFMLEYNVRAASVLGVVGAGGIGYDLKLHIDYGNYHVVGAILLILAAVVLVLDAVSGRLRARLMGR
jgi:phosphonate transport system permease protein